MADGDLILKLDEETARRLQAAADAAGRPVEEYALDLIEEGLDEDWAEANRRLAEYDRTGEYVPLDEALARFQAVVNDRPAKPR